MRHLLRISEPLGVGRATVPASAQERRRSPQPEVRPSIRAMLDAMTGAPAVVRNDRLDILATNPLGRALYSELSRDPGRPANHARFAFLDPRGARLLGRLGTRSQRHRRRTADRGRPQPLRRAVTVLVGELSTRNEEIRTRWAAHNVNLHRTGNKVINHPVGRGAT